MTSSQTASFESRDTSTSSAHDRRPTSSTFSTGTNRVSIGSNGTGESSTAASQRSSLMSGGLGIATVDVDNKEVSLDNHKAVKDGRSSHRSRTSKNSGGFLLDNPIFDPPLPPTAKNRATIPEAVQHRHSTQYPKGKTSLRSPEKKHIKRRSNGGSAIGGSPLAANVINAGTGNGMAMDTTKDGVEGQNRMGNRHASTALDVDSAQIVNLALNLSESRRNASRRIMTTPILPQAGFGESFAGGSLRQHLQQQRRVSRNVSPKPDRGQRAMTASPRITGPGIASPLQGSFDNSPEESYQYYFSASTLARAEKAKKAIGLMAQYRRLLQYVPPLKSATSNSRRAALDSPSPSVQTSSRPSSSTLANHNQLGRQYNPLQYIRNRKVRSRNSRAIDGEAQGFGDLEKVSTWVDFVAQQASHEHSTNLALPPFSKPAKDAASPNASPQSSANKGQQGTPAKIKRPRIDWMVNPADLIADVFWLEQDDNKRIIEDRHGARIFPQYIDQKRQASHRKDPLESLKLSTPLQAEDHGKNLRVDTKLPEFKSVKQDTERISSHTASRARRKLHDKREHTKLHHGHNRSTREARLRLRSHSKSASDSSESDIEPPPRRRRGDTAGSDDRRKDILEKQMMEMIAREQREASLGELATKSGPSPAATRKLPPKDEKLTNRESTHSRSESLTKEKHASPRAGSSGRPSLEVPGGNPRSSLDDLNTTAPNSPVSRAIRIKNAFIPSLNLDQPSSKSRQSSPTRAPLAKMKSKIKPLYGRGQAADYEQGDEDETLFGMSSPAKDNQGNSDVRDRPRSTSPVKRRTTEDALKKNGSLRKGKIEDSGIRGLFKARNPVSRVSDLLFKKEPLAIGTSSGFSTDESDFEDARIKVEAKGSRESSAGLDNVDEFSALKERSAYLRNVPVLPTFTSPFEQRGRSSRERSKHLPQDPDSSTSEKRSRGRRLNAPRIDVQNASPTSSPDVRSHRYNRDSSVSDMESRRGSLSHGVQRADARLNSILGFPGRRNALPVTGLSSLETSNDVDTRPSLDGKQQWSISDRSMSSHRGPMTKQEIARVRALLLSSGIKAKEISRRAAESKDLKKPDESAYNDVASLARHPPPPVPKSQEHRLAARIIADNVQVSSQLWRDTADDFVNQKVATLIENIANLQHRLIDNLTPMTRTAADEADEVSKDLVTSHTLKVKRISDTIDKMTRRRRRRFRWLRRGGWVLVEWLLVGIMWYVWFLVVIMRVFMGIGRGINGGLRWLFWMN